MQWLQGFFLPSENIFPYFFPYGGFSLALPLSGGNIPDELLHTVCAFPLHLLGNMTVNVQRKGRCRMAQVALYRLNVIPAFYRSHGIRVAEVMKTGVGTANRGSYFLERLIDHMRHEVSAHFVCEHKAAFFPGGSNRQFPFRLPLPLGL